MKLSEGAKKNGLSYRTAWRLFSEGKLPVPAQQLQTGTILVTEEPLVPRPKNIFLNAIGSMVSAQLRREQKKQCK
jgi:putative resolvase